jgi:hypothetical protein
MDALQCLSFAWMRQKNFYYYGYYYYFDYYDP